MPRSQGLEPEEEKVPDDGAVLLLAVQGAEAPVEADHDVAAAQGLLSELQQGDESLLGALAELTRPHTHVEPASPEDSIPGGQGAVVPAGGRRAGDVGSKSETQNPFAVIVILRFVLLSVFFLSVFGS